MKESEAGQDTRRPTDVRGAAPETEPMLYCPVCSTRLTEQRCKLVCAQCGYYMSCADYY